MLVAELHAIFRELMPFHLATVRAAGMDATKRNYRLETYPTYDSGIKDRTSDFRSLFAV
jgi:hypothetical protein